jgi:uncharacterized protein
MLFLLVGFTGKRENRQSWFQKSHGSRWCALMGIGFGLISFTVQLIPNIHVMNSVPLIIAWCGFALINSPLEEAFWRGLLLDETVHLPRIYGVAYSSILFIAIHPLNLGVFSKIQSFDPDRPMALIPFILILLILSLVWSLLYIKTKSLRLSILSQVLTDLGNLSIFLFMNMVTV